MWLKRFASRFHLVVRCFFFAMNRALLRCLCNGVKCIACSAKRYSLISHSHNGRNRMRSDETSFCHKSHRVSCNVHNATTDPVPSFSITRSLALALAFSLAHVVQQSHYHSIFTSMAYNRTARAKCMLNRRREKNAHNTN